MQCPGTFADGLPFSGSAVGRTPTPSVIGSPGTGAALRSHVPAHHAFGSGRALPTESVTLIVALAPPVNATTLAASQASRPTIAAVLALCVINSILLVVTAHSSDDSSRASRMHLSLLATQLVTTHPPEDESLQSANARPAAALGPQSVGTDSSGALSAPYR